MNQILELFKTLYNQEKSAGRKFKEFKIGFLALIDPKNACIKTTKKRFKKYEKIFIETTGAIYKMIRYRTNVHVEIYTINHRNILNITFNMKNPEVKKLYLRILQVVQETIQFLN